MKTSFLHAAFFAIFLASPVMAQEEESGDKDYRTFSAGGEVEYGAIEDSYTADLVMYLAGNQFMVMEDLIKDFQSKNPDIETVYVETIPPGQILNQQILKQGQIKGKDTAQNPDLYASVNLGHLKKLKAAGLMDQYMVYTRNRLSLMIAEGNPKDIKGAEDLSRDDLVQSHPNPQTEGIFRFYGSQMLKDMGIYEKVTGNADCKGCWAVEGKTWFTERHHRETPDRIEAGEADVGIVWETEVRHAKAEGRKIDGVEIPASQNQQDKVAYAIGKLTKGRNSDNAETFLDYLRSDEAQAIYENYGFVRASADELTSKPIPAG
ncbi:molybdate ABC transporter substrate-binding protein [Aurantimonas marina]|uniref:molybdate ABC transporter substrate-binding protein n=1 Tax=Aurantimonas marina TaxID=2780508 RepID=UPI0019D24856|nr:substrate-binding domain-containing protein [Aurantimonas marina]